MDLVYLHGLSNLATAAAYYIIGSLLIYVAAKVYLTNPVNRVFIFGEYFTPLGVNILMACWPLVSLFGVFIFACAAEHNMHYLFVAGDAEMLLFMAFMGWVEAAISLITAAVVVYMAVRWWVVKRFRWQGVRDEPNT